MKMKSVGVLCAFFLGGLGGCATNVVEMPDFKPAAADKRVNIVDARPDIEKKSEFLSLLITQCDYGIRRIGDEVTRPSRIELLQSDLSQALGQGIHGKSLRLTHYTIFLNMGATLRRNTYGTNSGLVTSIMEGMGSRCSREQTSGGWYASSELTAPYSPIIIEISVLVDGVEKSIRMVYSPAKELDMKFSDPLAGKTLFDAMRKANRALADRINS